MTPQRVQRNYLAITGFYNLAASLIWGVNTLFLMNAGLDIFEVFIVNGIFTASMALFEIPTGVLADTRGRRTSFLFSVIITLIGTLGYLWIAETSGSLVGFGIMSVVIGLGFTFYTGAVDAWLVDALTHTGYKGDLDKVFARGGMVMGAAMLVGTLSGGILGTLDLAIPYMVRSILLAIVFLVAWVSMHDIGYAPRTLVWKQVPREMGNIAAASLTHGWKVPTVKLLMISSFIQALFMMWGFYAWQPYFLGLLHREDAVWVAGIIAAMISISFIIGNSLVGYLTKRVKRRTSLLIPTATLVGVAAIGVGIANNFYLAVGLYLLVGVAMGLAGPVRQAFMHRLIPSEQRATIVSFDALVGSGGSFGGQLGLGYLARRQSLSMGYITGGFLSLFVIPVLMILRKTCLPKDDLAAVDPPDEKPPVEQPTAEPA